MHHAIQIRRAEPHDAAAVAKILYEAFVEYEPLYTREGFAATGLNAQQVLARISEGPVWVAERDAEAVGTVAAVARGGSAYMRGMAVLPSTRGSRVGARLLEVVEQWAAEQGYTRIFLSTTPFLHAAIRLYESHGFVRTDEDPHDLYGTPLFTMEKIFPLGDKAESNKK
jgi:putative acetyltransferase